MAYPSATVKDRSRREPVDDLKSLLAAAKPQVVYTHNPMDKHDTHVAVALRCIAAIRALPPDERPRRLFGGEVWRDLDWLPDDRKVVFDCSRHGDLQRALLEVFQSQIAGGKRYDLAAMGRRRANATYLDARSADSMALAAYAVDLTPLIGDEPLDIEAFTASLLQASADDVQTRLERLR